MDIYFLLTSQVLFFSFFSCLHSVIPSNGGQAVTSCAGSPCKNDAICEDTETGYQCFCVDGFAGDNCDINFDDCSSGPCKNNATCVDGVADYTCTCPRGFAGKDCQINIDECLSNPCLMNGTCIDLIDGFVCECPPPFRGDNCSLLPCDTLPCENQAECEDDVSFNKSLTGYVCNCIVGFSGFRCELNLEDCDIENGTSCNGNGLCIDGINDYSCLCEPGWIGDFCQLPVNDCIGNDCRNNGTCVDQHLGYICACLDGYEGDLCERERDECTTWFPCQNEAVCIDLFNDYRCECKSGWIGVNCSEEVNECLANRCLNGAQCLDIVDGFICRCPPFFTGELCETAFNPCSPEYNPCQNGANCIAPPDGGYVCFCPEGFTGANCEVNINECLLYPCDNNGTCEDIIDGYVCHCRAGWTGLHCSDNIDDCLSQPCSNGATCFDLLNGFRCNCTAEYAGRLCEEPVDFCIQTPCFNDGTCIRLIGDYQCQCLTPYTGRNCLDLINACESSPCLQNSTCMNTPNGYECVCEPPYTGKNCDIITDYCASQPCLNGGSCRQLRDGWICICPMYLTGRQCTDLIDYCGDNRCLNGGLCINNEFGFRCVCLFGYTGNLCQEQVDFCADDPCLNFGSCSNIPGGFICECSHNYTGEICEFDVEIAQETPTTLLPSTTTSDYLKRPITNSLQTDEWSSVSLQASLGTSILVIKTLAIESSFLVESAQSVSTTVNVEHASLKSEPDSALTETFRTLSYSIISTPSSTLKFPTRQEGSSSLTIQHTQFTDSVTLETSSSGDHLTVEIGNSLSSHSSSQILSSSPILSTDNSFIHLTPTVLSESDFSSNTDILYSSLDTPVSIKVTTYVDEVSSKSKVETVDTETTVQSDWSLLGSTMSFSDVTDGMKPEITSSFSPVQPITVSEFLHSNTDSVMNNFDSSTISLSHKSYTGIRSSTSSASELKYISITDTDSSSVLTKTFSSSVPDETDIDLLESSLSVLSLTPVASSPVNVTNSVLLSSLGPVLPTTLTASAISTQIIDSIHPQISAESTDKYISSSAHGIPTSVGSSPIASTSTLESSFLPSNNKYSASHEHTKVNYNTSQIDQTSQNFISSSLTDLSNHSAAGLSSGKINNASVSKSFETLYPTFLTDTSSFTLNRISLSSLTSFDSALYTMPFLSSLVTTPVDESKFIDGASDINSLVQSSKERPSDDFSRYLSQSEYFFPFTSRTSRAAPSDTYVSYTQGSTSTSGSKTESKSSQGIYSLSKFVTGSENKALKTSTPTHSSLHSSTIIWLKTSGLESRSISLSSFDTRSRGSVVSVQTSKVLASNSMTDVSLFRTVESQTYLSVPLQSSQEVQSTENGMSTGRASKLSFTQTYLSESVISQTKTVEAQSISSDNNLKPSVGFSIHSDSRQPSISRTDAKSIVFTLDSLVEQPNVSTSTDFNDLSYIFPSTSFESFYETSYGISGYTMFSTISIASIYEFSQSQGNPRHSSHNLSESISTFHRSEESRISDHENGSFTKSSTMTPDTVSSIMVTLNIDPSPSVSGELSSTTIIPTTSTLLPESCDTFSCENGGICQQDMFGPYCDCPTGFIGLFCTTEVTACGGIQCENGGVCTVFVTAQNQQIPVCNCPMPYTGTICDQELLIYYPYFHGQSFLAFGFAGFSSTAANELFLSLKTTQLDGTVLISTSDLSVRGSSKMQPSFIHLYIEHGMLQYRFSCDGLIITSIETGEAVNTGNVYDIIIRQMWPSSTGEWCSASLIVNSRMYISTPVLTANTPQTLGDLVIGGILRDDNENGTLVTSGVIDGYVGCVHNLQINGKEIDMINMANRGMNIENCNVPVCQYNPCKNGASCHSVGEDWYCACLAGYGGDLCETKLCGNNPCYHGGSCVVLEAEKTTLCICPYGRAGTLCEKELKPALPHFSGTVYGHTSYIAYSNVHFVRDNFEIEFSLVIEENTTESNLIMFMGNDEGSEGTSDYFVVALFRGYLLMRYDLGSGQSDIYSPDPVNMSTIQHHVKLGRNGRLGWLKVDDQNNVTGLSMGVLTALNVNSFLYVGGHEHMDNFGLQPLARFEDGLKGCVYDLKIRTLESNFVEPGSPPGHVDKGRNIRACSSMSCDPNPCLNEAECVDLGASIFCNCSAEWKGILCTDKTTVCDYNHTCSSGSTCLPTPSGGYRCVCPLGKKGDNCSQDFIITDPLFVGEESYMSFTPVYIKKTIDIFLQIKADQSSGLLFYVALRLHSNSGDFLSITLLDWTVELRYSLGSDVNVLRSAKGLQDNPGTWHTVQAGRNSTHGYISVDGNMTVSMTAGTMLYLDTTTDFYLGGLPALEDASPFAFEDEPVAFEGCIREFRVNDKQYDLNSKVAKDGRNIGDCDGTGCGYNICHNGGECHVMEDGAFNCSCTDSYYGDTCTMPVECRNHECYQGDCVPGVLYRCYCYLGWIGERCDIETELGTSVSFKKTSYLICNITGDDLENTTSTHITLSFRSASLNGMLFWNGQTFTDGEDYLGVGLVEGRLKVVWNLGWYSRTETITSLRYNDGQWHSCVISRQGQLMSFIVDGVTYESRVTGDFYQLDTDNLYHFGGFTDGVVKQQSLDNFLEPFVGCVKDFSVNGRVVSFHEATNGLNIEPCETD